MKPLVLLIGRELGLAYGRGGGPLPALAFYAALTALIPLSANLAPKDLSLFAPGLSWVALALSTLLALERLFERDFEDGALDLLALGPASLEAVGLSKAISHFIGTGLPLGLAAPVAAVILGAPLSLTPLVFACALAGGLAFSFLGAVGAALALGSRQGGLLIAVIVLPLFVPPVIFGGTALGAFATGGQWLGGFSLLCAYAAAAAALSPVAIGAACRNALS